MKTSSAARNLLKAKTACVLLVVLAMAVGAFALGQRLPASKAQRKAGQAELVPMPKANALDLVASTSWVR